MTELNYKVGSMITSSYAAALEESRRTGLSIIKELKSYQSCKVENGNIAAAGPVINVINSIMN